MEPKHRLLSFCCPLVCTAGNHGLAACRVGWLWIVLRLFLSLLAVQASIAHAEKIDLGINIGQQSVSISRVDSSDLEVANLETEFSYSPVVSAKTADRYLDPASQWGYFYQIDFSLFDVNKQTIPGSGELRDIGTRLKGYSVYVVPVMFYNFSRFDASKWHKKLGLGVGLGLLSLKGNFRTLSLTDPTNGNEVSVDAKGVGLAVGVLFAFEKSPHNIILQNFAPTLDVGDYSYLQHNIEMSYRYSFEFDL